jgi:periplasmic protein TonB
MKAFGQIIPMHKDGGITEVVLGASPAPRRSRWIVPAVLAVGAHLGLALTLSHDESGETWALSTDARVRTLMAARQARPVELPIPPPEPPKPVEPPRPEPTRSLPTTARAAAGRARAQAPAQAGQVVARIPSPDEPVDFGDAFVVGGGTVYAGGTTTASGTAKHKVDGPVSPTPAPPKPAAPVAIDHSRAIALADPDWTCPWPREADDIDSDEQVAVVKVEIGADGRCRKASVVRDPGNGFGAQAARCAQDAEYLPALDSSGRATPGTAAIRVRFVR